MGDQCVPDNVRTLTARTCAHCRRPIVKGQFYYETDTPTGKQPVHDLCMQTSGPKAEP